MVFDPSRRRALSALLAGAGALAVRPFVKAEGEGETPVPGPPPSKASAPGGAVVAKAQREGLVGADGSLDGAKLDLALGAAVARAAGEETPLAGMRSLFKPQDVVGIKLNCIAGKGLSPQPAVVDRLVRWLQEAGVPARNILIWDRTDRELKAAGFTINRGGEKVRCFGTEQDYDWTVREWGPAASSFPKFLVNDLTALINVGVLKDHGLAGVSVGLKNWYGAVHNPNKLHDDGCNPYIAPLAAFPLLAGKVRLTVIDATTAQCNGGPGRSPRWAWPAATLLASTAPAAVDAIGWSLIEDRRAEMKLRPLAEEGRTPRFIAQAEKLGLGPANPKKITLAEV